jgi:predicted AlkP superfamily phosphohydrolase/phosphomutase
VAPHEVDRFRDRLLRELSAVITPSGDPIGVTVLEAAGAADLMIYLGDLAWRAAGTVGHGRLFLDENDTGPDDAVHSKRGVFLLYDPRRTWGQRLTQPLRLVDIAPTMLRVLDCPLPAGLSGRPLEYA